MSSIAAGVAAEFHIRHPLQHRVLINSPGKGREVQFSHPTKEKF